MYFINKLKNYKKLNLIIITSILFLNTILTLNLHAVSFKVSEIEVSEQFDLNFNKKKVFDKAFNKAFSYLTSMVVTSSGKQKLKNVKLSTIKSLIDSFNIMDEKFINNKYYASFNVSFNKKNTLKFFEENNIFPSIPKRLDILFIPILINTNNEKLMIFNENPIYSNWNKNYKDYELLNYILPNEDIEDREILKKNIISLEDYNFEYIIEKYDIKNFIINIVYITNNQANVYSKIKLKNENKIINKSYQDVDLNNQESLNKFIQELKITFEDSWKNANIINTSIKLPLTVFLPSKENVKVKSFENLISELDLISDYYIINFNNENIYYKIIYNGSPDKFLKEVENHGFLITKSEKSWKIE